MSAIEANEKSETIAPREPQVSTQHDHDVAPEHIYVIEPRTGIHLLDWRELVAYRDLFLFLIWKEIRVRYAQSALGIGWAIIQPLFSMVLFTVIFGNLVEVDSGGAPYALFSLAALLPWTYFSNAVTEGVSSLVGQANMLRKIYFPRLLIPFASVVAKLVDFGIACVMMGILMIIYRHAPSLNILLLPLLVVVMIIAAGGISIWLSALAVQYRDVNHAMGFLIQLAMYASPVVYSAAEVPAQYRLWYALNPMVGVIEGFRSALLGTQPMPWDLLAVGTFSASTLLFTGLLFFKSKEKVFADVA